MQDNIGVNKRKNLISVARGIKIPSHIFKSHKKIMDYDFYDNFAAIEDTIEDKKEDLKKNLYNLMDDVKEKASTARSKGKPIMDSIKNGDMMISKKDMKFYGKVLLSSALVAYTVSKITSNKY